MDITNSLIVIVIAALIHASFQLSVSVLTLLSGHTIGSGRSKKVLIKNISSFIIGALCMSMLLLLSILYLLYEFFGSSAPNYIWALACGLMIGIAILVWIFYYRRSKGTSLWIPRSFARYLSERTKATKSSAEAFNLGLGSVFAELPFITAPLLISALVILQTPGYSSLLLAFIYVAISICPMLIILWLCHKNKHLAGLQKWREDNKRFLQFSAGAGLIILAIFIYINQVVNYIFVGA